MWQMTAGFGPAPGSRLQDSMGHASSGLRRPFVSVTRSCRQAAGRGATRDTVRGHPLFCSATRCVDFHPHACSFIVSKWQLLLQAFHVSFREDNRTRRGNLPDQRNQCLLMKE